MIGIGALIGIVSSVIQIAQAVNRPDPVEQKADKLFSQLDALGQGEIQSADLQTAFEKIKSTAAGGADKLFTKLDSDGDGKLTRSEFSGSINQLAEQLDQHFQRVRMHGDGRVSLKEAQDFGKAVGGSAAAQVQTAAADSRNVEMMLMVVRLMQAYGVVNGNGSTADSGSTAAAKVSDQA